MQIRGMSANKYNYNFISVIPNFVFVILKLLACVNEYIHENVFKINTVLSTLGTQNTNN